ncbi:MAG: hypothetical protein DDT34_01855 [Firmicutes bacterium]|nr:hypothetical protein [Bacillota bacterium]MBT9165817.1 hypothetical protein [Chloroflexota bacterium]
MLDNPKLDDRIKPFMDLEGPERIRAAWPSIWINTAQAKKALLELDDLLMAPDSSKAAGLVISGDSDTGKSRVMERFAEMHRVDGIDPETEYAQFPVIYVRAPTSPNRGALLKLILDQIGQQVKGIFREEDMHRQVVKMLRACGTKVLIIDELQQTEHLAATATVRAFLRGIKALVNDTGRPIAVGGTPDIIDFIRIEPQVRSRFDDLLMMKPMTASEEQLTILAFERLLPLRRASDLRSNAGIVAAIQGYSLGYIGRLSRLLQKSCVAAVRSGEERLTLSIVEQVGQRSLATSIDNFR